MKENTSINKQHAPINNATNKKVTGCMDNTSSRLRIYWQQPTIDDAARAIDQNGSKSKT